MRTKLTVFNYNDYIVKLPLVSVGTPVYEGEHQVIYQGQDFHSVASNSCNFFIYIYSIQGQISIYFLDAKELRF